MCKLEMDRFGLVNLRGLYNPSEGIIKKSDALEVQASTFSCLKNGQVPAEHRSTRSHVIFKTALPVDW